MQLLPSLLSPTAASQLYQTRLHRPVLSLRFKKRTVVAIAVNMTMQIRTTWAFNIPRIKKTEKYFKLTRQASVKATAMQDKPNESHLNVYTRTKCRMKQNSFYSVSGRQLFHPKILTKSPFILLFICLNNDLFLSVI